MPDSLILADMREYLARQRAELAEIGGRQYYAEALRQLGGRRPARLKTFARLRLLAYVDMVKAFDNPVREAALVRILELTRSDVRQARAYAKLLLNEFVLRGWLGPAARAVIRKSP